MEVLTFWFPDDKFQSFWFDKSVDDYITNNFSSLLNKYEKKKFNTLILSSLDDNKLLEIIIVLDQFSRNIYRKNNFKRNDDKALKIAKYFFENREWRNKQFQHLVFYLMPLRHSNVEDDCMLVYGLLNEIDTNNLSENQKFLFKKFYAKTMKQLKKFRYKNKNMYIHRLA